MKIHVEVINRDIDDSKLYNTSDISILFDISYSGACRLMKSRKMSTFKLMGHHRVSGKELIKFINRSTIKSLDE